MSLADPERKPPVRRSIWNNVGYSRPATFSGALVAWNFGVFTGGRLCLVRVSTPSAFRKDHKFDLIAHLLQVSRRPAITCHVGVMRAGSCRSTTEYVVRHRCRIC